MGPGALIEPPTQKRVIYSCSNTLCFCGTPAHRQRDTDRDKDRDRDRGSAQLDPAFISPSLSSELARAHDKAGCQCPAPWLRDPDSGPLAAVQALRQGGLAAPARLGFFGG